MLLQWLGDTTAMASIAEVTPQHLQQYQLWLYNYEAKEADKEPRRLSVGTQACRLAAVQIGRASCRERVCQYV